nr:PREDICTED: uncharacterized protein YMR317W [Bemisia tabaci]
MVLASTAVIAKRALMEAGEDNDDIQLNQLMSWHTPEENTLGADSPPTLADILNTAYTSSVDQIQNDAASSFEEMDFELLFADNDLEGSSDVSETVFKNSSAALNWSSDSSQGQSSTSHLSTLISSPLQNSEFFPSENGNQASVSTSTLGIKPVNKSRKRPLLNEEVFSKLVHRMKTVKKGENSHNLTVAEESNIASDVVSPFTSVASHSNVMIRSNILYSGSDFQNLPVSEVHSNLPNSMLFNSIRSNQTQIMPTPNPELKNEPEESTGFSSENYTLNHINHCPPTTLSNTRLNKVVPSRVPVINDQSPFCVPHSSSSTSSPKAGPSRSRNEDDGPIAPELQLDWLSSTEDEHSDDSGIEVVSIKRRSNQLTAPPVININNDNDNSNSIDITIENSSCSNTPPKKCNIQVVDLTQETDEESDRQHSNSSTSSSYQNNAPTSSTASSVCGYAYLGNSREPPVRPNFTVPVRNPAPSCQHPPYYYYQPSCRLPVFPSPSLSPVSPPQLSPIASTISSISPLSPIQVLSLSPTLTHCMINPEPGPTTSVNPQASIRSKGPVFPVGYCSASPSVSANSTTYLEQYPPAMHSADILRSMSSSNSVNSTSPVSANSVSYSERYSPSMHPADMLRSMSSSNLVNAMTSSRSANFVQPPNPLSPHSLISSNSVNLTNATCPMASVGQSSPVGPQQVVNRTRRLSPNAISPNHIEPHRMCGPMDSYHAVPPRSRYYPVHTQLWQTQQRIQETQRRRMTVENNRDTYFRREPSQSPPVSIVYSTQPVNSGPFQFVQQLTLPPVGQSRVFNPPGVGAPTVLTTSTLPAVIQVAVGDIVSPSASVQTETVYHSSSSNVEPGPRQRTVSHPVYHYHSPHIHISIGGPLAPVSSTRPQDIVFPPVFTHPEVVPVLPRSMNYRLALDNYIRVVNHRRLQSMNQGASQDTIERTTFPHKYKRINRTDDSDDNIEKCTICLSEFEDTEGQAFTVYASVPCGMCGSMVILKQTLSNL